MNTNQRKRGYVVTLQAGDASTRKIWNTGEAFRIGHPLRWVLEKTETGVRVRNLDITKIGLVPAESKSLTHDQIESGQTISLGEHGLRMSLKSLESLPAAWETRGTSGGELHVYSCRGELSVGQERLEDSYMPLLNGVSVFRLKKCSNGGYNLSSQHEGLEVKIQSEDRVRTLESGETLQLGREQMSGLVVKLAPLSWRFAELKVDATIATLLEMGPRTIEDQESFHATLKKTFAAMAAFIAIAMILPKPEPKELEPKVTEFAKIVFTPQAAPAGIANEAERPAPATATQQKEVAKKPEKVVAQAKPTPQKKTKTPAKSTAVAKKTSPAKDVQPFAASSFQKMAKGLLKGGMSGLLAKSEFAAGRDSHSEARQIFNGRSAAAGGGASSGGTLETKSVRLTSFGGAGVAGSASPGYGKGMRAAVSGQGRSFVSLDTLGSDVDEGLTKDEVGRVIHKHLAEVRYCYEAAILRTPEVEGKLSVHFVIGGRGMVKTAKVNETSVSDGQLDDCLIRKLQTWKFPNPKGGIDVAVNYPFIFKTLGR